MGISLEKRRRPEDVQCLGKVRYEALDARRAARSFAPPLQAYPCPWCRHWHIGGDHRRSRQRSQRRRRRAR